MAIPFTKILLDLQVHSYLGRAPDAISDCLITAFRDIRDKRLTLKYLPGNNPPFYATACGHLIIASIHADSNTVVILDARPTLNLTGPP